LGTERSRSETIMTSESELVNLIEELATTNAYLKEIAESLKTLAFHVKKWEEAKRGF
jgi:hypothetical protein